MRWRIRSGCRSVWCRIGSGAGRMWPAGWRGRLRGKKAVVLTSSRLGNSVGTGPKPVVAPVVLINNFDELEQHKDDLKGKIVFYNYHFNPLFVETFQAYSDAVRYRGAGASRAAKYGAVGVLVRSMSESVDNVPHTGAMNVQRLFSEDSGGCRGAAGCGPSGGDAGKGVGRRGERRRRRIDQVYLRTGGQMLPDTIAHNVIGELRGTEFPDQYITVGGHLDQLGSCRGRHG